MNIATSIDSKVYFVVVVYNKECEFSPSIKYAISQKDIITIIVVDNSTITTSNESFCHNHGIVYINMNENAGLSRAYNRALSYIGDECGYVVWADDDTLFPDNYCQEMICAMSLNRYTIGLPLVLTGDKVYSPISVGDNGIPKVVTAETELGEHITGINSGMMVNLEFYKQFKYDEDMFLDFIDHDVCVSCEMNGGTIGFVNRVILRQNSFFSSRINLRSMLKRRKIYRHDFRLFCKKHDISPIIAEKTIIHGEAAIAITYIKQVVKR